MLPFCIIGSILFLLLLLNMAIIIFFERAKTAKYITLLTVISAIGLNIPCAINLYKLSDGDMKECVRLFKEIRPSIDHTNTTSTSVVVKNQDQNRIEMIREWKQLLDEGIITEEEFNKRKSIIIDQ